MVTVRETRSSLLLDFIVSALHEGKGVIIKIKTPNKSVGHLLTIYGYRRLIKEKNFVLYFTDSDDHLHKIRYLKMDWNNATDRWEAHGLYSEWYLEYVISLARY